MNLNASAAAILNRCEMIYTSEPRLYEALSHIFSSSPALLQQFNTVADQGFVKKIQAIHLNDVDIHFDQTARCIEIDILTLSHSQSNWRLAANLVFQLGYALQHAASMPHIAIAQLAFSKQVAKIAEQPNQRDYTASLMTRIAVSRMNEALAHIEAWNGFASMVKLQYPEATPWEIASHLEFNAKAYRNVFFDVQTQQNSLDLTFEPNAQIKHSAQNIEAISKCCFDVPWNNRRLKFATIDCKNFYAAQLISHIAFSEKNSAFLHERNSFPEIKFLANQFQLNQIQAVGVVLPSKENMMFKDISSQKSELFEFVHGSIGGQPIQSEGRISAQSTEQSISNR